VFYKVHTPKNKTGSHGGGPIGKSKFMRSLLSLFYFFLIKTAVLEIYVFSSGTSCISLVREVLP